MMNLSILSNIDNPEIFSNSSSTSKYFSLIYDNNIIYLMKPNEHDF